MVTSAYGLSTGNPVPCNTGPSNTAALSTFDGGGMVISSSSPDSGVDDILIGTLRRAGTHFFNVDPDHRRNERRFGNLRCCATEHLGVRLGVFVFHGRDYCHFGIKFHRCDRHNPTSSSSTDATSANASPGSSMILIFDFLVRQHGARDRGSGYQRSGHIRWQYGDAIGRDTESHRSERLSFDLLGYDRS